MKFEPGSRRYFLVSGLVVLAGLFVISWTLGHEDGSVGGGLSVVSLMALGLPWSVVVFFAGLDGRGATVAYALCGLLNLLIVATLVTRRRRRPVA